MDARAWRQRRTTRWMTREKKSEKLPKKMVKFDSSWIWRSWRRKILQKQNGTIFWNLCMRHIRKSKAKFLRWNVEKDFLIGWYVTYFLWRVSTEKVPSNSKRKHTRPHESNQKKNGLRQLMRHILMIYRYAKKIKHEKTHDRYRSIEITVNLWFYFNFQRIKCNLNIV